MFQQLLAAFSQSPQGQQAYQRLQSQGVPQQQASSILDTALPAAAQAMHSSLSGGGAGQQPLGVLEVQRSNYVTNFLSAAVSGLVRGQGLKGAAVDGVQGVVGGHVAQVIASRFGFPQGVAGAIGAVITPLLVDFLWQRMQGGGLDLGSMFGGGAGAGQQGAPSSSPTSFDPYGAAASAAQGAAPPAGDGSGAPQPQQQGGALQQLTSGFSSLFQSDPGSFTPSGFNPYG